MEYNFKEIEAKWQRRWQEEETYRVEADPTRPKFYVLDMFPYPSGAGLHVGHPLGYIASDIYSRYKRLCGFNVLHPMGYDAFGLPAEQYAIQTGQHPAVTTERNIARYREQLDKIGFSFDWHREVRTCDPSYYKWTQWAFLEMFKHYYDRSTDKAEPIEKLVARFEAQGTEGLDAACTQEMRFTADEWKSKTEEEREQILQNYRLAFRADTMVNWCPQLGTVLANDEVKDGLSERGGFPVEQKRMKQWLLRVTAYAQRMLDGLERLEWSDSLKEIQRNWIGRSEGAQVFFDIQGSDRKLEIFTTRPDTIFGVTFMVIAPEHEWVHDLTTSEQRAAVEEYIAQAKKRSERERIAETKRVSGVATGSYAINPFTGKAIPIYISDYVLAGYGTGAIMAVPAHDSRDYAFARHFGLEIIPVVEGGDIEKESYDAKSGKLINSDLLDGLDVKEAIGRILGEIERRGLGRRLVNYRLRDAIFSRQRYWGEPFPIYYKEGTAYPLPEERLPLELPPIDNFGPTEQGEPPLARAKEWTTPEGYPLEVSTMPGFAGSSAYYLRYMDPHNDRALVGRAANEYWRNVDLEKTRFGYELRATGNNKNAAKYCGMAEKRNIILTLVISGALAGMGAAMLYLTGYEQWQCSTSSVPGMGFNGIAAAFLGGLNPFGTILASFFIQHITAGGAYVDKTMYCAQISDLISALIIYLCGFVLFMKYAMNSAISKREEKAALKEREQSETPPADANTEKGGDQ